MDMKQIIRLLLWNKRTTLLLVLSLSIGLSAYMLIAEKVIYNQSFDTYLDNYKNIYRLVSTTYTNNVITISQPRTQRHMGKMLETNFPEVKQSGYLCGTMAKHYKIGDNTFTNENGYHCSHGFVQIFAIKIVSGNSRDVLTKPNKIILSESFARKHFGDNNPIGKIIRQYPANEFEVEAIFKDFPNNSHVKPDFLISFHDNMHLPPPLKDSWGEISFYTYLVLDANSDKLKLENGAAHVFRENNKTLLGKSDSEYQFRLQAIKDIHTKSQLKNEISKNVRGDYLSILQMISVFVLIVSGFNYVYFSYTRIEAQSVQYGMRKALGAKSSSLLLHFMIESLIVHSAAFIISLLAIEVLQHVSAVSWGFTHYHQMSSDFWINLLLVFMASACLNPLVLLLRLYNKSSLMLLTRRLQNAHKAFSFRQVFVTLNFVVIIFLIASITGITKQVNYLKGLDKGINTSDKLVIKTPSHMQRSSHRVNNLDAFEQQLAAISGVLNISKTNNVPGDIPTFAFTASDQKDNNGINTALFIADSSFLKTFDINLVGGSNFRQSVLGGSIINTVCMKQLGYTDPIEIIGKKLYLQDESAMQLIESVVVGVCNDFNFTNAKETPDPIVLLDWARDFMWGRYTLSLTPNMDRKGLVSQIENYFIQAFPNYTFEYFWLEDYYNKQFEEENLILSSLNNFALIAILIGVLSILSMAWQMTLSKTKEIGIRKVNGAKQYDIIILLNLHFVRWIGIAALIAIPVSWYFLSNWLSTFAYQTNLSVWIFLISAGCAFFIGISTVTLQSLKVANMNPVESLKHE